MRTNKYQSQILRPRVAQRQFVFSSQPSTFPSNQFQCSDLAAAYPSSLLARNTTSFDEYLGTYWSKQSQDITPLCAFKPADTSEVAVVVRLAKQTKCQFAVRSGSHGTGASNIQDGLVVSLENLNEITVSADKSSVTIGPGNTWARVYKTLEEKDVAVAGGRYPSVGVGGLIMGGGISFFAATKGWTCNNVFEYEVVLANGKIIIASKDSHPDLFWALCGAGSVFGIVTSFKMEAFPLAGGKIWGGLRVSTEEAIPALLQAVYNFGKSGINTDPNAAMITSLGLVGGTKLGVSILTHADATPHADSPPAVMKEFLSIPAFQESTSVRTIESLITEMSYGDTDLHRRRRSTATFRLDLGLLTYVKDTCYEEFQKLADVPSMMGMCVFQIISKQQLEASEKKGGNPLGLDVTDAPYFLLNTWLTWDDATVDTRIDLATRMIVEKAAAYAKGKGLNVGYRYLNYAGEFQDAIASYGGENGERLKKILGEYDGEGVMGGLRPGIFGLKGAPAL